MSGRRGRVASTGAPAASMQQAFRTREGIGFCRFVGRTIILDIAADRYWQLGEDAAVTLEAITAGGTDIPSAPTLARLASLGFLAPVTGDHASPESDDTFLPQASVSAIEAATALAPLKWAMVCEVAILTIIARVAVRTFALKSILDRIVARRSYTASSMPDGNLEAIAQRFMRWRRLLPLRTLCLPDSIAFLWFAMRRGHGPRLVFGVEAFPFTAHCWVQERDVVLNDALHHTSRFKRIMVI